MARGIERRNLFSQDRDYEHFLELLGRFAERFACNISAYVLMPNHFHLFLQTMEPNLSRALQWLSSSYAAWFNARYGRSGHLFQGRFKAVLVDPDEWAVSLSRYIHLNPVRVGRLGLGKAARAASGAGASAEASVEVVRERVALLRSFRWSSYRAYAGYEQGPNWLQSGWILARCGRSRLQRRPWYRSYCEEAVREGLEDPIAGNVLGQLCLGGREFLEQVLNRAEGSRAAGQRPGFPEVRAALERVRGERWEPFANKRGDWTRDLALYLMRENGHSLRTAATAVGIRRAPTAGMALQRLKQRLHDDKTLRKILGQVKKALQM